MQRLPPTIRDRRAAGVRLNPQPGAAAHEPLVDQLRDALGRASELVARLSTTLASAARDEADDEPAEGSASAHPLERELDEVRVDIDEKGRRPQVNLRVADGDMGRIIGKRGRMANAIRTVTRAAASHDGVEIDVAVTLSPGA